MWLPCLLGLCAVLQAGDARPVASPERGWPQFRGARRDGICDETGLLASWPEGGPRVIWSAGGLGKGYSSPVIADGRIHITGEEGEDLKIFALDLEGRLSWTSSNGRSWKGPYPGARASCTYHGGRLYHMNAHGRAACLDAATGREIWAVDVLQRFGGAVPTWGISECLLVDGKRVIVTPCGEKAVMAALDAMTGDTVWAAPPLRIDGDAADPDGKAGAVDAATYASPSLFELDGRRHLVGCSARHVFGVDPRTGHLLWKRPVRTRFRVLALTPVPCGDGVFMTAPDSGGGKLYRILSTKDGVRIEEAWTASIDTCHGGVLHVGDLLVGSWYRDYDGWGCVDARSGEVLHRTDELSMGSAIHADGRFYCLAQDGVMALVEADSKSFRVLSRFKLPGARRDDAWAHPVIQGGRLYLRYHENLYCHDIRAPAAAGAAISR